MIFILKKLNHIHLIRQKCQRLSRLILKLHSEAKNENKSIIQTGIASKYKKYIFKIFYISKIYLKSDKVGNKLYRTYLFIKNLLK